MVEVPIDILCPLELLGVWKFYCAVPAIARGIFRSAGIQRDRSVFATLRRDKTGDCAAWQTAARD